MGGPDPSEALNAAWEPLASGAGAEGPRLVVTRLPPQERTASWTRRPDAACPASAATGAPARTGPTAGSAASARRAAPSRARAARCRLAPSRPARLSCSGACGSASTSRCPSRRCPPRTPAASTRPSTDPASGSCRPAPPPCLGGHSAAPPLPPQPGLPPASLLVAGWWVRGVRPVTRPAHPTQVCHSAAQRAALLQRASEREARLPGLGDRGWASAAHLLHRWVPQGVCGRGCSVWGPG